MSLLCVEQLEVRYASSPVLRGVSVSVGRAEVVAVVGANGAGKTTLLRAITGLKRAQSGRVLFKGESLAGLEPQAIVAKGVRFVPQERALFPYLSVLDNLKVGAFLVRSRERARNDLAWVFSLFPVLGQRQKQLAHTLSGGEQQMLAIGRALMGRPELLILDEPSLALSPAVVKTIARIIEGLCQQGTSVLLVEQNVKLALSVAQRAYALSGGRVVLEGPAELLCRDPRVQHAYLGGDVKAEASAQAG